MYAISNKLLIRESTHALSYLCPSPILEGHAVIFPKRTVSCSSDLSPEENSDFWETIQIVARILKETYNSPALTIELKDRVNPIMFANVIPRKAGDLESNDRIYPMLENLNIEGDNEGLYQAAEIVRKLLGS
jgi:bis(5'-adenosyl)-triphosphatase